MFPIDKPYLITRDTLPTLKEIIAKKKIKPHENGYETAVCWLQADVRTQTIDLRYIETSYLNFRDTGIQLTAKDTSSQIRVYISVLRDELKLRENSNRIGSDAAKWNQLDTGAIQIIAMPKRYELLEMLGTYLVPAVRVAWPNAPKNLPNKVSNFVENLEGKLKAIPQR